jgi:osmotically inducible lipoprotein OsmB
MQKTITALCLLTFLSACGHDPGDRALSGGAIGAGGGAVGAAILGANPLAGAALGAGAGALTGALTSPRRN